MSPPPDSYHVTVPQGTLRVTVLAAGYTLYRDPHGYPTPVLAIATGSWPVEEYLTFRGRLYSAYARFRFNNHSPSPFRCEEYVFIRCHDRKHVACGTATWTALTVSVDTAVQQFVDEQPQWWQQSLQLGRAQHVAAAEAALAQARDELTTVEGTWQRWLDTYPRLP